MPSTALAAELLVRVRTTWRHFASPVTLLAALAAHWALVPRTRDRPAALSSSSGNCREAAHAWAPHHTKFLHQYCSYVNPSGSCMWKKKNWESCVHMYQSCKTPQFTLGPSQSFLQSLGILPPVFRRIRAGAWWSELSKQLLPWNWGLHIQHRLPITSETFLWAFCIYCCGWTFDA